MNSEQREDEMDAAIIGYKVEEAYESNTSQDLGAMIGEAIHAYSRRAVCAELRRLAAFKPDRTYFGDMVNDEILDRVAELDAGA